MIKYFYIVSCLFMVTACGSSNKSLDASDIQVINSIVSDSSSEEFDFSEEDWAEMMPFEEENPYVRSIYNPSRTLLTDLIHTKLEVSFNWEKSRLNGKATITAKQHFHASDSLILDAKGMDILAVEMNAKKLAYSYSDSLHLRIQLDRKYSRDENFTVSIQYVAKPEERKLGGSAAITSDKGLYFINPKGEEKGKMPQIWTQGETEANSVWFPTLDSPNAKSTEEIIMTVQDKYMTLANGKLISSKKNTDGTRTDHWKQDLPHAPYLFMMAVGEFKTVKDSYTRKDGSKMDVVYIVEPEYEKDAKAIFGETPEMIRFFSEKLGVEYPWDKYAQIVVRDYVSGAMENTGAVVFGDYVYKNERELLDANDQSTIAHELFHHWFGDLVTCESWANLPLNESFANYAQYLWDEHRNGLDEADFQAENEADGYYGSASNGGYLNLIRYDYDDKEQMFDGHSYNKGGRILHMLRNYLGDEAFFKGLNLYLTSNKYKAAEVHHLRLAFEEVSGEDLNWFFDQWFLNNGHPVLEVSHQVDKENKQLVLTVTQLQNYTDFPIYKLPVDVAIWDESGKTTKRIVIDSVQQSFQFPIKGALKNVLFDEAQMLLGKVYEVKSVDEFAHQFTNAKRWKARNTAFNRVANTPTKQATEIIALALKDPFWNIRLSAINVLKGMPKDKALDYVAQLKDLALNDPKSDVRSAAIEVVNIMESDDAIALIKAFLAKEKSYNAISSGLNACIKVDEKEALTIARGMKNESSKTIKVTVSEVFASIGDSSDYDFFDQIIYHSDLKNYDELRAMISYAVYISRMNIDLQEKSHAVYIHYNEVGAKITKYWLVQAIQFNLQNYQEQVNNLEMEIAELEEAKSYAKADEKKRIKQRYEDLIQNLIPLTEVEESIDFSGEGN